MYISFSNVEVSDELPRASSKSMEDPELERLSMGNLLERRRKEKQGWGCRYL